MRGVLAASRAVLLQLDAIGIVSLVFFGVVIPLLALVAPE
jgi:hypothetical protein